jgi:hypothetical protein
VPVGCDHDEEVSSTALLFGLDQDARGVGAQVRRRERVAPHGVDQRARQLGERRVPAAHRRARQLDAVASVDLFEPVQRQVVLPATDDGVREKPGTGQSPLDRQLRRRRAHDLGLGVALAILAHELGSADADHDHRRRAPLDGLAHLLADGLVGVTPVAFHFGRNDLDVDAGKIRRQRLPARRPGSRVLANDLGWRRWLRHRRTTQ